MTKHKINNVQGNFIYTNVWRSYERLVASFPDNTWMRVDIEAYRGFFSITARITKSKDNDLESIGCLHDDILNYFPELAPLIKYHLWDGVPMHYVENTLFHASDRDYRGLAKGEPIGYTSRLYVNDAPIGYNPPQPAVPWLLENLRQGSTFEVMKLEDPLGKFTKFTLRSSGGSQQATVWYTAMFNDEHYAQEWCTTLNNPLTRITEKLVPTSFSEGGKRDLEAARRCAAWPEATDEQLCLPREELKALLEQRKDALTAEFQSMLDSIGFSRDL